MKKMGSRSGEALDSYRELVSALAWVQDKVMQRRETNIGSQKMGKPWRLAPISPDFPLTSLLLLLL